MHTALIICSIKIHGVGEHAKSFELSTMQVISILVGYFCAINANDDTISWRFAVLFWIRNILQWK